jgi:hypothetical protein
MKTVQSIVLLAEADRDVIRVFLYPVVPSFSAAMVSELKQPVSLELRSKILNCLEVRVAELIRENCAQNLSNKWTTITRFRLLALLTLATSYL